MEQSASKRALEVCILILAFFYLYPLVGQVMAPPDKRPNVIFFALDDLNDWITPLGDIQAKTPNMDGISLVPILHAPASAQDRNLFVPYTDRGSYSVINSSWRYIHYEDGSEELYNLREDSSEWYNLAGKEEYGAFKKELQKSAPDLFAPVATSKSELTPVVAEDGFRWVRKSSSD